MKIKSLFKGLSRGENGVTLATEGKPSLPKEEPAKAEEKAEAPVFKLDERPVADIMTEGKPSLPEEEPARAEEKAEAPAAEAPTKHLIRHAVQPEALRLIPEVIAGRYNAVPLAISDDTLEVAMVEPTNTVAIGILSTLSQMKIKPIAADAKEIQETIYFNYKAYGEIEKQLAPVSIPGKATAGKQAESDVTDTPLAQAPNLIFEETVKADASDINMEPEENALGVCYRIDGILHDLMSLPPNIRLDVISQIKNLPVMNIDDRLNPRDGQFSSVTMGRNIDMRVASPPTNQARGSEGSLGG